MGNKTSLNLRKAVESGNLDVLKTLLDNGGDINVQNHNGDTLLHVAVNKKNNHQSEDLVTLLLERGANPRLQNGEGNTPLILAVKHNPKCVPLILRNGSGKDTVNIPNKWGHYPLDFAWTNVTVFKELLDNGGLIERKIAGGRTYLHVALIHIHNESCWSAAFKHVLYNIFNQLLMHGAEVNSKDKNGRTPLHMTDDIKCVRLLLDKGALVNSRDNRGNTPLHRVSYDAANELLMHGAEVNSTNNNGDTPLHMAHNVKCVRLLLDKGALVNHRNSVGETPLHKLSMYDRDTAYELLLHGADVNSEDNYGNTPLHTACDNERDRLTKRNGQDRFVLTILDYLDNTGHETYFYVANVLLDWGASLTTKNNKGRTPSDIFPDLLDWAKPHNVRKACVKLSDIPCKESDLNSYWISCLEEVARLKLVRFGKNSLYDIFSQYFNPIFLSNEPLQKAVDMNNCKEEFPIYCCLFQSTYKLAEKRSCMLNDAADTLQTPLPREITRYILTFVDDDSLRNVIRAKVAK